MKNIIALSLVALATFCVEAVSAKTPTTYKVDNLTAVAMPQTTVTVELEIVKTSIRTGPYARFSQKFLGVVAPLADKDIYKITGAKIGYYDLITPTVECASTPATSVVESVVSNGAFGLVTPDRMIIGVKSAEDMARDAATQIFTLRKRRLDLITGEAGENVFGAGLSTAIAEISRLENELLSLFVGKQIVTTEHKKVDVVPTSDKQSFVVARFSEAGGMVADSDLSGSPIVLLVMAEPAVAANLPRKEAKINDYYHVAAMVNCKVMEGTSVLAADRIPVLQYGRVVSVPAPSQK